MGTLGTMIGAIRTDLDRGSELDGRIQEAIVNAIKFYRSHRYGFNTGRSAVLMSAERTSLSVDMLAVDTAVLQVDGVRLRSLKPRTSKWIDEEKVDETWTSEPVYYASEDRQMRLHPSPDRSYTVVMHGHFDYTNISLSTSDSTATNPWMVEGYELIKSHAMAEVLSVYIRGDEAQADASVLQSRATAIHRALKRRANLEHDASEISPCM